MLTQVSSVEICKAQTGKGNIFVSKYTGSTCQYPAQPDAEVKGTVELYLYTPSRPS